MQLQFTNVFSTRGSSAANQMSHSFKANHMSASPRGVFIEAYMAKFQEKDHTSTAPISDIPLNNHLTFSSSLLLHSALSHPETRSCDIASPEHSQTFVRATSGSTHLIMDFVSLSPSDDLSDEIRITIHLRPSTFPSSPYPRLRFQWPYSRLGRKRVRRAPTSSHPWFVSCLVHLPSTAKIIIVRLTTPPCLPAHLLPQQRQDEEILEHEVTVAEVRRSSPQFADSFTSKKRSLPPSFCQHQPNNSPVATSPRSGEFPQLAFIFYNHRLDSSHSPENDK